MAEAVHQQQLTDTGYRGARLGAPFVYRWIDQEPTSETWRQRADQYRYLWSTVFVLFFAFGGVLLAGNVGLILAALYLTPVAVMAGYLTYWRRRTDGEPIPRPVAREAYIEYVDDEFCFVLEVDGKPFFWDRWSRVQQFEVTAYWAMFGDAGQSPYKTDWHAIVMDPIDAAPWCIASTIEGMAAVRERRAALDAKFGMAARTTFLQRLELERSATKLKDGSCGHITPLLNDPSADTSSYQTENERSQQPANAQGVPLKL